MTKYTSNNSSWKRPEKWEDYLSRLNLHHCIGDPPFAGYGDAINECSEDEDGYLEVLNGEYASLVNFCPFCGFEAKRKYQNYIGT